MIDRRFKFKRHIIIGRALLVCVSLFIVSACGIPTSIYLDNSISTEDGVSYYEFSSSETSTTSFSLYIDTDTYQIEDSPSLCYFYAIVDSSDVSPSSTIISDFESKYSDLPGSRLDTNSSADPYVLTDSSDSYKLYKFTYQNKTDSDILDQEYLSYLATLDTSISDNTTYKETGVISADLIISKVDNDDSYYFTFDLDDFESDDSNSSSQFNTKTANEIYESTEDYTYNLLRYNGAEFIPASDIDEDLDLDYELVDSDNNCTVIVFVALTVEGDFTNIFWSDLHEVGTFSLD
ncbi:MAG: hypothetical protein PQJ49_02260 [Sphaerochaetaceae bacterium]|nr:hypothetical protein [Sphaerochaetaceae bacterium]MDC7248727.1 hypothetical protein [Sphaerochaetaceae bacterium]